MNLKKTKDMKNKSENWINIKKASTHNLKDVSLSIPRGEMTVFTGLSGSGKSSLAFDTIFAEGQRRYIESLSAYARQFLRQTQKPEVEEITGLSPAISIDQKNRSNNPRSTVATITEIYDYMRVLFARVGIPYCPHCGNIIEKVSKEEIIKRVEKKIKDEKWLERSKKVAGVSYNDRKIKIFSPVVVGRKGTFYQQLYDFLHKGYDNVRVDGKDRKLREKISLEKNKNHDIDLLVDVIYVSEYSENPKVFKERMSLAIEQSLKESNGLVRIEYPNEKEDLLSAKFICAHCGFAFVEIEPRLFSFNSPYGACEDCHGLGTVDMYVDEECGTCNGARLRKEALSVFLGSGNSKKNIVDIISLTTSDAYNFLDKLKFSKQQKAIAEPLMKEILSRLSFLVQVGLEYLALNRRANTLSGGEAQRIRLASQLGSGLVGSLYVLDEPTIGLHQRDNEKLINTLVGLRNLGNTVIVVEHDEETIFSADYLVDIGPGAGEFGGEIVVDGYVKDLLKSRKKSLTLDYLKGVKKIETPKERRKVNKGMLKIKGATRHNLKKVSASIPLGRFNVITGVSGSGKSTFLHDIVYRNLERKLNKRLATAKLFDVDSFEGYEYLSGVYLLDQSPIGRTPRSTPVTYVGAYTYIRDLFASSESARYHGWTPSRFSFNVKGGRCEKCEGHGTIGVEMHFLPTTYVECDECNGHRFTKETLEVEYKGKNIYEVLDMSVYEAEKFFRDIPAIQERMQALLDVGLGYIRLGQASTTLSGGEAQRVKIASELYRRDTRGKMYLLDEPTVGLHYEDVNKLIDILNRLVDRGNTIVVIEHNLDLIKCADNVIDFGPNGGDGGGKIIATGAPESVSKSDKSVTGKYIKKALKK